MLSQEFINEMKSKLLAEQERLENELKGLPTHVELGNRDDDNALEAEDDEVRRGIKTRVNADLEKVKKALDKIEGGTYGTDDEGNPIAEERLKVLPWADKAI
jgi:RNA polymerase-binding transcription factor DksA